MSELLSGQASSGGSAASGAKTDKFPMKPSAPAQSVFCSSQIIPGPSKQSPLSSDMHIPLSIKTHVKIGLEVGLEVTNIDLICRNIKSTVNEQHNTHVFLQTDTAFFATYSHHRVQRFLLANISHSNGIKLVWQTFTKKKKPTTIQSLLPCLTFASDFAMKTILKIDLKII